MDPGKCTRPKNMSKGKACLELAKVEQTLDWKIFFVLGVIVPKFASRDMTFTIEAGLRSL